MECWHDLGDFSQGAPPNEGSKKVWIRWGRVRVVIFWRGEGWFVLGLAICEMLMLKRVRIATQYVAVIFAVKCFAGRQALIIDWWRKSQLLRVATEQRVSGQYYKHIHFIVSCLLPPQKQWIPPLSLIPLLLIPLPWLAKQNNSSLWSHGGRATHQLQQWTRIRIRIRIRRRKRKDRKTRMWNSRATRYFSLSPFCNKQQQITTQG